MKNFPILILLCLPLLSFGQLTAMKGRTSYNYWQYLPHDSVLQNKPPILIFLHGRSLSGTNLETVKRYGVISEISKGREIPAIVLGPQVASGSWNPDLVLEVLQDVQKRFNTDSSRVYVCGMSLGGYGTMHFVGKYPDRVTAGVALCGGGNTRDACNLASLPFWIQHGTADEAVPVSESRVMRDAINSCNGSANLKYVEVPGANHGAMERLFRSDELYDWLFSHVKP
jgi:predicted peptidase